MYFPIPRYNSYPVKPISPTKCHLKKKFEFVTFPMIQIAFFLQTKGHQISKKNCLQINTPENQRKKFVKKSFFFKKYFKAKKNASEIY